MEALIAELTQLLRERQYERAIDLAKKAAKGRAAPMDVFLAGADAYRALNKNGKAASFLKQGLRVHPKNETLLFAMLRVQIGMRDAAESSRYFDMLKDLPGLSLDPQFRRCRQDLATMLWEARRREEALDLWRLDAKEHPEDEDAQKRLAAHENEYGAPKAPNVLFDDLYRFIDVQKEAYMAMLPAGAQPDKRQMQEVLARAHDAWNTHIAPLGAALDDMSSSAKEALFEEVTYGATGRRKTPTTFSTAASGPTLVPPSTSGNRPSRWDRDTAGPAGFASTLSYEERRENAIEAGADPEGVELFLALDDILTDYMPETSGIHVAFLFASMPAVEALGLTLESLFEAYLREDDEDADLNTILDMVEVLRGIFLSQLADDAEQAIGLAEEARAILEDYFDEYELPHIHAQLVENTRRLVENLPDSDELMPPRKRRRPKRPR